MAKQKFYVVWEGVTPGVYTSWTDCQLQIKGYEGAKYKSFDTREEAERALATSLALLKQKGFDMPIYSDSVNAISWVRQKKCKTKLPRTAETEELFKLIERAEKWLRENTYTTRILKWETKEWGEIPADFGRK